MIRRKFLSSLSAAIGALPFVGSLFSHHGHSKSIAIVNTNGGHPGHFTITSGNVVRLSLPVPNRSLAVYINCKEIEPPSSEFSVDIKTGKIVT